MINIEIGKHTFEFWTDLEEEISINRYIKWFQYLIMDSTFNEGVRGIVKSDERFFNLLRQEKIDDAINQRKHSGMAINNMLNGLYSKSLALACIVKSIDGKAQNDLSEEGLQKVSKQINESDISKAELDIIFDDVKKNFNLKQMTLKDLAMI